MEKSLVTDLSVAEDENSAKPTSETAFQGLRFKSLYDDLKTFNHLVFIEKPVASNELIYLFILDYRNTCSAVSSWLRFVFSRMKNQELEKEKAKSEGQEQFYTYTPPRTEIENQLKVRNRKKFWREGLAAWAFKGFGCRSRDTLNHVILEFKLFFFKLYWESLIFLLG